MENSLNHSLTMNNCVTKNIIIFSFMALIPILAKLDLKS